MGFFQRLSQGLKKTKDTMMRQLSSLFSSSKLDGDFYEELEDIPNWRWVWETKMLPLCKTVWEKYRFSSAHRRAAVSYNNLGDISKAEGDLSGARKYFEFALEINKQLTEESPTSENR